MRNVIDKQRLIFVLEDDVNIGELIRYNLQQNGYAVKVFSQAKPMLIDDELPEVDLFLLDVMLPDIDGYSVCRQLRQNALTAETAIIMLTAKSTEPDRVKGLEIGADDYICKPFGLAEFMARVKAAIRRSNMDDARQEITLANISLLVEENLLKQGTAEWSLTQKETELLRLLLVNVGIVMRREVLINKIWGYDYDGESRTLDVHIRYLRQKLTQPIVIETIRGVGYKLIVVEN